MMGSFEKEYSHFINLEANKEIDIPQDDFNVFLDKMIKKHFMANKSWYKITNQINWYKVGKNGIFIIDGSIEHPYGTSEMIPLLEDLQRVYNFYFKKGGIYRFIYINEYTKVKIITDFISNGDGRFIKKDGETEYFDVPFLL